MYGKIYEQTFTGSMYGSGSCVFALWSYVIAHTKPDAMVELNPQALSSTLGEDIGRILQAIEHFKSPDPRSRSKEFEGRRLIQKGEFIYFVPQYHKYHGFANDKERRSYFAQKKREQRQRDKGRQTDMSKESNNVKQSESNTETKTEEIYHAFPLKVGKPDAIRAIRRALLQVPFETLLEKTKAFAAARNGDLSFCPNPSTWFNQERYNDDPKTWIPQVNDLNRSFQKKKETGAHNLEAYKPVRFAPELTDEQIAKNKEVIAEEKAKLKQQFRMP